MQGKFDVIVVGGGFAGTAAAISAARRGADVLLIERYNALGGAAVNCLVMPFMDYWTKMPETGEKKYLCGNLFLEIDREMKKLAGPGANSCCFDEEILKLVLNRLAIKSGVKLLFNTNVTDVTAENGKITKIKAMGKSAKMEFEADVFIDATGDGELSYLAGCEFVLGREKDSLCQPMTLCFRMSGVNLEKFKENRPKINPLYKEFQEKGLIRNPRENVLIFENHNDGVLHFNTTRVVKKNPTDPFEVTEAEIEAREQVFEMHKFLKENIPGFENCRVLSTALQIGIRESRKIVGEYVITQEDLKNCTRFPDGIATGNYDIDIHNPEGSGTSHYYFGPGKWYEIPYRSLLPKNTENLLVAGRCISSTHEAQASYRIMPFCCEIGQAAGIAAAMTVSEKNSLRKIDIEKLRNLLREEGFAI